MQQIGTSDLKSIYCFADKVCSEPYQNGLMDATRESYKADNIYPSDVVIPLSDAGLVESQLVKFVIDGWAYDMVKRPQRYIDGHIKDVVDCWAVRPEIISALLRAIWGYQEKLPSETPMEVTGCHYHVHAEESKCSAL